MLLRRVAQSAAQSMHRRALAAPCGPLAPCRQPARPWLPSRPGPTAPRRQQLACRASQGTPPAAPSLSDGAGAAAPPLASTSGRPPAPRPPPGPQEPSLLRKVYRRVTKQLANLQLALAELALIGALSAVGTVIKQGQPFAYYAENYPEEGQRVLGFLTGSLIWALQWDHVYTADYFLLLLGLLAASLAACTATNQWPAVKVARRWRFKGDEAALARLQVSARLPNAALSDVGRALAGRSYQVFVKDGQLYGFKGLSGKLAPIGVHASMLLCMLGFTMGAVGSFTGTAMIPEGGDMVVASALRPASPLAWLPSGAEAVLSCDDFRIEYRPDGSIKQFYSDLTVRDLDGRQLASKTVSVNAPLRFGGVTAYQTDWSMSGLQLRAEGSKGGVPDNVVVQLPMASLGKGDSDKLYATFLPAEDPSLAAPGTAPRGVSILARDLQTVTFYDSRGEFAGVRRLGSGNAIEVEGMRITPQAIVASTGLEIKADPGVPLVYAGFGGLCITVVVSYLSHSQVWATQSGSSVLVGGTSNRAKVFFQQELGEVMGAVPEVLPPAAPAPAAAASSNGSNGSGGSSSSSSAREAAQAKQQDGA